MGGAEADALVVIAEDELSAIVSKGEVTPRYYNPRDMFDEVHLLLLNDDDVSAEELAPMAGGARLRVHRLGRVRLRDTLGWRPSLIEPWVKRAVGIVEEVRPLAVRAYGNYLAGYVGAEVRARTGVPLVVSLHARHDDWARPLLDVKGRLISALRDRLEHHTLANTDVVIGVYRQLLEYASGYGARDVRLIYNSVNDRCLLPKTDYAVGSPPTVISVGRHCREKDPALIVRAIGGTETRLELVGQGPLTDRLRRFARRGGLGERVRFTPAVPNDVLCHTLREHDVFAIKCDFFGIPKTLIEAMLAGMPCVVNRRPGEPVPEIPEDAVMLVDGSEEGYREAFRELLSSEERRRDLGRRALTYAWRTFAPVAMEERVADVYREVGGIGRAKGGGRA